MRIGLVGAGFIGLNHIRVARDVPNFNVVAYVDPHAKSEHADLAALRRHHTLADLLADKVDGVIIAVPDDLHVTMARQCLTHGVAVFLEKPAARSLVECIELSRAPRAETRLLVGHQRRHHPATHIAKRMLDAGDLGTVIGAGGVFALRKDDPYFVERPRGVGLTNLIHDLDLLQHFCGAITEISAAVSHHGRGAKEEDTVAFTMTFSSGVIGSFIGTDSAPSPWGWDQATMELASIPYLEAGTAYQLLGTKGSLAVPDLRVYKHRAGESWHHPLVCEQIAIPAGNAYTNQFAHFADVIAGTAKPIVGVTEAIATQAALDGIFASARDGRRVSTTSLIERAQAARA